MRSRVIALLLAIVYQFSSAAPAFAADNAMAWPTTISRATSTTTAARSMERQAPSTARTSTNARIPMGWKSAPASHGPHSAMGARAWAVVQSSCRSALANAVPPAFSGAAPT